MLISQHANKCNAGGYYSRLISHAEKNKTQHFLTMWRLITVISSKTIPRIIINYYQALTWTSPTRVPPDLPFSVYSVLYLDCAEVLLQLHTGDVKVFWVLRSSSLKPFHIHERSVSARLRPCTLLWTFDCDYSDRLGCGRCKEGALSLTGPHLHTYMFLFETRLSYFKKYVSTSYYLYRIFLLFPTF